MLKGLEFVVLLGKIFYILETDN